MLRYVFAVHRRAWARQLGLPLTLTPELATAMALEVDPTPPLTGHPVLRDRVAVTFDDGPHPEGTPAVLEVLAEYGVKATFFVVGEQVVKRPELLRRIAADGHRIALHGYEHALHLRRSREAMDEDFTRGIAAIEDAVDLTPVLHRPPYGIYSPWSLQNARARGLNPMLWSAWGRDWRRFTTPNRIARRALVGIQSGDVILLHDADFYSAQRSYERTVRALPLILAGLKSGGLDTV